MRDTSATAARITDFNLIRCIVTLEAVLMTSLFLGGSETGFKIQPISMKLKKDLWRIQSTHLWIYPTESDIRTCTRRRMASKQ